MSQRNRLNAALPTEFAAPHIDRNRPIRFTVDGIPLDGFVGDTVLSALLANGVVSAGSQAGYPVALDAESAPPVRIEGRDDEMPMALCPAADGVRYETVGARKAVAPLKRLLAGNRTSLDHNFDEQRAPGRWIDAEPEETIDADFVIVGGGVSGMAAALAAAGRKARVLLVERDITLGGVTVFFGKAEGEELPEELVAKLADQVSQHPQITVLTRAEAFDIADGVLRVVQVVDRDGLPSPRHLAIRFADAVLATGSEERLPIFPGNRLPGMIGAVAAWRMARQFSVWPGESFHLHTATNAGYRMAMLGSEAGKAVHRASDPRLDPRTRFIEFCKAYGFRLGWGTRIAAVSSERDALTIRVAGQHFPGVENEPITADTLIVSGGWQPALALWLRAGGRGTWDAEKDRLVAEGAMPRVALAGSAAGFTGTGACVQSGKAAVASLRGAESPTVADPLIDELYESPDSGLSISHPESRGLPPAWIGPSRRSALPEPSATGLAALIRRNSTERTSHIRSTDLIDVAASIASGHLPAEEAEAYCAQWCIVPRVFSPADLPAPLTPPSDALPDYLVGRFGIGQAKWRLRPQDARVFDPGCLIFINTDETHPRAAIGAILSSGDGDCVALMARTEFGEGDIVYVRDGASCTPARLGRKRS